MRRRRMHRVADQHDAALRPRPRQQQRFERAVDDAGVVAERRRELSARSAP